MHVHLCIYVLRNLPASHPRCNVNSTRPSQSQFNITQFVLIFPLPIYFWQSKILNNSIICSILYHLRVVSKLLIHTTLKNKPALKSKLHLTVRNRRTVVFSLARENLRCSKITQASSFFAWARLFFKWNTLRSILLWFYFGFCFGLDSTLVLFFLLLDSTFGSIFGFYL